MTQLASTITGPVIADLTLDQLRAALKKPVLILSLVAKAVSFFYDVTPLVSLVKDAIASDEYLGDLLIVVNELREEGIDGAAVKAWFARLIAAARARFAKS